MKLLQSVLITSVIITSHSVYANDFKLAYSEEYKVDVFTESENWCQQDINITLKKQQESTSAADIEILFQKVNKVIQSQCPEASIISGNVVGVNPKNSFQLLTKKDNRWVVEKTTPNIALTTNVETNTDKALEETASLATEATDNPKVVAQPAPTETEVLNDTATDISSTEPAVVGSSGEAVVSEPVASEPVASEPVVSEPVVSEPVVSEPVVSEPVVSEPVVSEPVVSEPVVSKSVVSESAPVENSVEPLPVENSVEPLVSENDKKAWLKYEPEFAFYNDEKDYKIFNANKDCAIYLHNIRKPEEIDFLIWETKEDTVCVNGLLQGEHTLIIKYIDGRPYLTSEKHQFEQGFQLEDRIVNIVSNPVSRTKTQGNWSQKVLITHLGYLPNNNYPIYGYYQPSNQSKWTFRELIIEVNDDDTFFNEQKIDELAKEIGAYYEQIREPYKYAINVPVNIVKRIEFDSVLSKEMLQFTSDLERHEKIWAFSPHRSKNFVLQRVIDEKKAIAEQQRIEQQKKEAEERRLAVIAEQEARRKELVQANLAAIKTFVDNKASFYDKLYLTNESLFREFFRIPSANSTFYNEIEGLPISRVNTLMSSALRNIDSNSRTANTFSIIKTGGSVDNTINELSWPEHLFIEESSLTKNTWYLAFGFASFNDDNQIIFHIAQTVECEKEKCDEYNDADYVLNKIKNNAQSIDNAGAIN